MAGFGSALRAERERLGLSVQSVSDRTRIPPHHLEAVEAGEVHRLPGGVFRQGILKAYLGALGLDADPDWTTRLQQFLRDAGAGTSTTDWAAFAQNVKRNRMGASGQGSASRWIGLVAMLCALLAVAFAVWHSLLQPRLR